MLEVWMWKVHFHSINTLAVHEKNSIMPHCDVKVAGPCNCLEGAAIVSRFQAHMKSLYLIISWCKSAELLWLIKAYMISVRICLCSQYLLDANIWWRTIQKPYETSDNNSWEDTNTGRIYLSMRKYCAKLEKKSQGKEAGKISECV